MGTTTYGAKASNERMRVSSQRPIGVASCGQQSYPWGRRVCHPSPLPLLTPWVVGVQI